MKDRLMGSGSGRRWSLFLDDVNVLTQQAPYDDIQSLVYFLHVRRSSKAVFSSLVCEEVVRVDPFLREVLKY